MNYTVNCNIIVLDILKGEELFTFLQQHFNNNIDPWRGNLWIQTLSQNYEAGNINPAKYIGFWATYLNIEERELIYNTINSYKQYCLFGDNVAYQTIQKMDTSSPTFGSPLFNIVIDKWGLEC